MNDHIKLFNHRAWVNGSFLYGSYTREGFISTHGELLKVEASKVSISTGVELKENTFLFTGDILRRNSKSMKWGVIRYLAGGGRFVITGPVAWDESGDIKEVINVGISGGSGARAKKIGDIFTTPQLGAKLLEFLKKEQ